MQSDSQQRKYTILTIWGLRLKWKAICQQGKGNSSGINSKFIGHYAMQLYYFTVK